MRRPPGDHGADRRGLHLRSELRSRLPTTSPEHLVGLIVYTAVVVYSGVLAVYYLFIHKATRVWS